MVGSREAPRGLVPAHDTPPFVQAVDAPVVMLEVVRVFPHIVQQYRELLIGHRIAVVAGGHDAQRPVALRACEPYPSGSHELRARGLELRLERREAPEVAPDRIGETAE